MKFEIILAYRNLKFQIQNRMYNLPYYKEQDPAIVKQFMKDHPFIFLIGSNKDQQPVATQVPVFMDEVGDKILLTGHIMKNTDHHRAFMDNPNVLAVFSGPHTYVSATWYDNPHQASTWNYSSVHAKGKIRFMSDEELAEVLKRLSLHYENNNPHSSTVFDNLPAAYREPLMKAIVAFEVEVTAIDHVFKLSQNRDEKSYDHIVAHLKQGDGDAKTVAEQMENRKSKVFPK